MCSVRWSRRCHLKLINPFGFTSWTFMLVHEMLHDLCWDDINEGTFQNPHRMRGVLGAKCLIKLNLPTVSSFVSYIFLVAVQWSNLRGQRTHVCDKIKKPKTKDQRGCLFTPLGGNWAAVPLVLTGGNRTVRLVSLVTRNDVIFTLFISLSTFTYWAAASVWATSTM